MSLPLVVHLVPAAVCGLSWLGAGAAVPSRFLPQDSLLRGTTRAAAGMTAVAVALYLIGRAGLFERWFVLAFTVVLAAIGAVAVLRSWRRPALPAGRLWRGLVGVTALALLLDLVAATAPPSSADALRYHLAVPELWLEQGRVSDVFWLWESFSPFGIEMLYAQGLALAGGSTASAVGALLTVAAAVAVYGLARELAGGNHLAAAAAAGLFTLQGLVTWEATSVFVEVGLAFFVALACWHVVRYLRAPAAEPALWFGFAAGAAAGTKYVGLAIAEVAFCFLTFGALLARRPRDLALASAAAFAAGGAWYVKNLVVTGNPFYPLFFGGKWWTDAGDHMLDALGGAYGTGGPFPRLVFLPIDLLLHGGEFDRGEYVGTAVFVFALAALALRIPGARAVWLGVLAYLVLWWTLSAQARFLVPALGVLAAIGGVAAAAALGRGRLWRAAALAVGVGGLLHWAVPSVVLTRQLLPSAAGLESRAEAAERLTGTYEALHAIARDAAPGTVAFAGYRQTYHYPGPAIQLGAAEFSSDLPRAPYLARLRREGVSTAVVAGDLPAQTAGCVERLGEYQARAVLSRSRSESVPLELVAYRLRC